MPTKIREQIPMFPPPPVEIPPQDTPSGASGANNTSHPVAKFITTGELIAILRRIGLSSARIAAQANRTPNWMYERLGQSYRQAVPLWFIRDIREAVGSYLYDIAYKEIIEGKPTMRLSVTGADLRQIMDDTRTTTLELARALGISRTTLRMLIIEHWQKPIPLHYAVALEARFGDEWPILVVRLRGGGQL